MASKITSQHLMWTFVLSILLAPFLIVSLSAPSQSAETTESAGELERSFEAFLREYRHEMRRRNGTYLKSVHPKLPDDMHDFFFDVTIQMMQFSEQEGLQPAIECQEFKVCKAIYPQPNDSWAAQRFILYEDRWHWLEQ